MELIGEDAKVGKSTSRPPPLGPRRSGLYHSGAAIHQAAGVRDSAAMSVGGGREWTESRSWMRGGARRRRSAGTGRQNSTPSGVILYYT